MPGKDDFSQVNYEPVAERILGFRAFTIDMNAVPPTEGFEGGVSHAHRRGMLRGVFQSTYVWGPGVNTAVCLASHVTTLPKHDYPVDKCMCGFWAYTTGEHVLSVSSPTAFGVIEAWGRMVIGPLGFRAEKARIVALCFPGSHEAVARPDGTQAVKLTVLSPSDFLRYSMRQVGAAMSEIARRMSAAFAAARTGTPPTPRATVTPVLPPIPTSDMIHRYQEKVTPELIATVRRLYPDAMVFRSVAAMQAEFPLTDLSGMLPQPEGEAS